MLFADSDFRKMLQRAYNLERKLRPLYTVLVESISSLTAETPILRTASILKICDLQQRDPKTELLRGTYPTDSTVEYSNLNYFKLKLVGLTSLELCLVVAMKRLHDQQVETFNFAMYASY
jgi:hypothetical protein